MNFKEKIANEKDGGEPVFEQITDKVFFQRTAVYEDGMYKSVTLREILQRIGCEHHYDQLVEDCKWRTEVDATPERFMIVQNDMNPREWTKDEKSQRLLAFWLGTPEGERLINGGVLFWHGKMSYHT